MVILGKMDILRTKSRIWHKNEKIHIYILKNSECYVIESGAMTVPWPSLPKSPHIFS